MAKKLRQAPFTGKLVLGGLEIPAFVLEDGTRVISGRGVTAAIGMKGRGQGALRITTHKTLKPYISEALSLAIEKPIEFAGPGGKRTTGYEATVLHDLCESILMARDAGVLKTEQEVRYATYADMLMRSFAKVGIIALVDEATGYQEVRARRALEEILEKFISEELRKWAKTFPDDFYKEMFRLRGWQYIPFSVRRPSVVGRLTNNIVYERLAPGVLEELRKRNPADERGMRKVRHHQWLTEDVGHPRLREHLAAVIALMKASKDYKQFERLIQRAFPKYGTTLDLPLDEEV